MRHSVRTILSYLVALCILVYVDISSSLGKKRHWFQKNEHHYVFLFSLLEEYFLGISQTLIP